MEVMEREKTHSDDMGFQSSLRPKFRPLGARVLVMREKKKSQTISGLFLPTDDKNKSNTGTIVSVGNGKIDKEGKRIPLQVEVGQRVLFSQYGGTDVAQTEGDSENAYVLVNEDDILAIIE